MEIETSTPLPHRSRESWLLNAALILLIIVCTTHLLVFAKSVLVPVLFGFYLSVLLYRPMVLLQRLFIPQGFGALLLVAGVFAAIVTSLLMLRDPVLSWLESAPGLVDRLQEHTRPLQEKLEEVQSNTSEVEEMVGNAMESGAAGQPETVVVKQEDAGLKSRILAELSNKLWMLSVTLILCYFFLVGGDALSTNIARSLRKRERRVTILRLFRDLRAQLAQYIAITMCVNMTFGVCIGLLLWFFGAEYAFLWGILVGLLRYIPYVGSVLALITVTAALAGTTLEISTLLAAPAATAVLMFITGNFIDPTVHARHFQLNPIFLFISIIFWSWIWGVAGLFIAVPTLLAITVVCGNIRRLNRIYHILCLNDGNQSVLGKATS